MSEPAAPAAGPEHTSPGRQRAIEPPSSSEAGESAPETGVVLWAITDWVGVLAGGREYRCQLRGAAKRGVRGERRDRLYPVVGDRVTFQPLDAEPGQGMISAVLPRGRTFSRRAAGPKGSWREQVLAANVDQVAVVFAVAEPEPNLRALDRFLVVAEAHELDALVVANKVDLSGVDAARSRFGVYERIGYPVWHVSARAGQGLDGLLAALAGRTSLVAGPSGVGKSSLLNALLPEVALRTGEVSRSLNKGRHTTVVGTLYPLANGGFVADTPGLRELGPWDLPPEDLDHCFREFRPYLGQCRWPDCLHRDEDRCAVRAAVSEGAIDAARYDSYRRLLDTL